MNQEEFIKILDRYSKGMSTPNETKMVENWYGAFLEKDDKPFDYSTEQRTKMFEKINENLDGSIVMYGYRNSFKKLIAIAAVAVFCVLSGIIYLSNSDEIKPTVSHAPASLFVNNTHQDLKVELADGSKVTLFPKSKLSAVSINKSTRSMRLEGKAFFEVSRDAKRPFIVFTEKIITKVLGTSFSIDAQKGRLATVVVKTGKVAVYQKLNEKTQVSSNSFIAISANHQVTFDSIHNRLLESIVKSPNVISMLDRKTSTQVNVNSGSSIMKFEEESASKILMAMEEAYGIKISFDNNKISKCIVTVSLKTDNFYSCLQTICDLIGGSYRVGNNEIEIISHGCK